MDVVFLGDYRPQAPLEVALGFFDGVHLGHQQILHQAAERARANGRTSVLFTFRHHPVTILRPAMSPGLLTTFDERVEAVSALGIERFIWTDFTAEFSQLSPQAFVRDVLVGQLRTVGAVAGFNYRFGCGAEGNGDMLVTLGRSCRIDVAIVPGLDIDGDAVSSTRIRALVAEGAVTAAAQLLGRPYAAMAEVVHGDGRGRIIGFPTANLSTPPEKLLPGNGVYASRVRIGDAWHDGVANIGERPTFGEHQRVLEVYVLDFDGDLYGRTLELTFVQRLRDELKFDGVPALTRQIERDVEQARQILGVT